MTDPSSVTKSDGPTAPAITASIGPSLLFATVDVTSLSLGAWDEDDELEPVMKLIPDELPGREPRAGSDDNVTSPETAPGPFSNALLDRP